MYIMVYCLPLKNNIIEREYLPFDKEDGGEREKREKKDKRIICFIKFYFCHISRF